MFAAVSLYWALGGTAGIGTIGHFAVQMARSRDARAQIVIWTVVILKALGALLPLSFVRPWGEALPRLWRGVVSGGAAAVLTLYGAVLVVSEALVELGATRPSGSVDRSALRWHMGLWDPWFLVWGLLLGLATWRFLCYPGERQRLIDPECDDRHAATGPERPRSRSGGLACPVTIHPSDPMRQRLERARQPGDARSRDAGV